MDDVYTRWTQLRQRWPALRLYALIDGVQYQSQLGQRIEPGPGRQSLFEGTADAPLAHAGPWLVDAVLASDSLLAELFALERRIASLTWLIAAQDLAGLAQLLQLRLDITLSDGRSGLLRFWDPRVLVSLAGTLEAWQREDLFGHVHEWHLLHEGRRVWIGRPDAHAQ
ncbi:DUF4123 domain-containing protein [Herbaspirillum rubrisubalbicans]|uniref:DUF4123 domain-containing protein n=1 Tax=Herbaspirillum rubrisubalbicans TaxID=80842 RepID=UPI0015596324|nr:DUF4123 domain-containing protein [Herbaspirillum rubrisubalbicans]NQE51472.1 hypothetical protein [Herbaspirillum rubrisubalbicans]